MLCQVFTTKISGFSPSNDLMQWEFRIEAVNLQCPHRTPSASTVRLPESAAASSLYEPSFPSRSAERSQPVPRAGHGHSLYLLCRRRGAPSSLKDRRCPGPSVRCPPCVSVSLVPQGGPVRCRGSAESALLSGAASGDAPDPASPRAPPGRARGTCAAAGGGPRS